MKKTNKDKKQRYHMWGKKKKKVLFCCYSFSSGLLPLKLDHKRLGQTDQEKCGV